MPLPTDPDTVWPPLWIRRHLDRYREWAAWYSGNTEELCNVYDGALSTMADAKGYTGSRSYFSRGRERKFWGTYLDHGANALRTARLHVPLASDITSASADLTAGEMPKLQVVDETATEASAAEAEAEAKKAEADPEAEPGEVSPASVVVHAATQKYLDELVDEEGLQATLLEGSEIAAAYGDVYYRIGWDKTVADHPFVGVVTPDQAIPEWRSGRLLNVIFWRVLDKLNESDDGKVWRHLELHEAGWIRHGLYLGTPEKLGAQMPLQAHPYTRQWAAFGGNLPTGAKRLTVEYVPNMAPSRSEPGSNVGRSDFDGITGLLDAVDESWSSWMRDLRLGKGRLVVPDYFLRDEGKGKGAVWDPEREVYQTIAALPDSAVGITIVQFEIRVEEHAATIKELSAAAFRGAGYSAGTFGEGDSVGQAVTATEIVARQAKSFSTRARKIGYLRPALRRLVGTLLEVAIKNFGPDGVEPIRPRVEFPDGIAQDPEQLGRAAQLYFAAEAASTYTRVKMVNPGASDPQVLEEVARIEAERKAAMPEVLPPGEATAGGSKSFGGKPSGKPAAKAKPKTAVRK